MPLDKHVGLLMAYPVCCHLHTQVCVGADMPLRLPHVHVCRWQ
jgi:hypothetical protein